MLEQEIKKYREVQAELIGQYPNGGYVVILHDEILGVWNDRVDALKQGIEKYGNIQFLVKNIMDDDIVVNFNRAIILG